MDALIWSGAALSLLGLVGLVISIFQVAKARRANLSEDDLRKAVQAALPLNMGSLAVSVIGLMMVILGIFLG